MQSIAQNFVAGVILLVERSIKPGDVLELQEEVVKVMEMGIRATVVQTTDGEDLIVPNSELIQSIVKNYTLRDSAFRVRVPVGVVYASDMNVVEGTLERVAYAISQQWGVSGRDPQVIMTGFGDNAVNFEVAIWMKNPYFWRAAVSDLHKAVWWAFKEAKIVIAFPQLDVHFDPEVHRGLAQLHDPQGDQPVRTAS